jgi:hypothetical protein
VPRLPGDPSVGRWLLFAVGFRLPAENREWVRHELTDAGWRGRTIRRLLVLMVPICIGLAFLPGLAAHRGPGVRADRQRRHGPDQRRRRARRPAEAARPPGP